MANVTSLKNYAEQIDAALVILGFSEEERKLKNIVEDKLYNGEASLSELREEVKDNEKVSGYLDLITKSLKNSSAMGLMSTKNHDPLEYVLFSSNLSLIEKAEMEIRERPTVRDLQIVKARSLEKTY